MADQPKGVVSEEDKSFLAFFGCLFSLMTICGAANFILGLYIAWMVS